MADPFDDELRQIKLAQERLETQLRLLNDRVHRLETSGASYPVALAEESLSVPIQTADVATPPPLPVGVEKAAVNITPPPIPKSIIDTENREQQTGESLPEKASGREQGEQVASERLRSPEKAVNRQPEILPQKQKESLEIRVGTFWLVRIGVVLLLTGLAFLGAYLYNNVFANLGPFGKVALLYLGSGILTGIGFWLERDKEQMRNFGRVLLGGGLAAVYYTTYAAYHVEWLRVLPDPVTAASLLIAWSGFMVWLCQRRKSETMAIFSILLAYYASSIGSIFWYSLVANLVLALAAMFLLVRHRWIVLSFTSLVATYGSYLYWRFYAGSAPVAHDLQNVVIQGSFLAIYWILFTAFALFAAWSAQRQRYSFASLNNALYFGAVGLSIRMVAKGEFWKFAVIYAIALACAALILNRWIRTKESEEQASDRSVRGMYAGQSICMFTLAVISYFSGAQLAMILGVEMALLVSFGRNRTVVGRFLTVLLGLGASVAAIAEQMSAWVTRFVDSFVEIFGMVAGKHQNTGPYGGAHALLNGLNTGDFLAGLLVGILALFSSWFSGRRDDRPETKTESGIYSVLGTTVLFCTLCIQLNGSLKLIALALVPLAYVMARGKIADHLRWQARVLALLVWWGVMSFIRHNGFATGAAILPTLLIAGIPVSLILVGCSIRTSGRDSTATSIYYAALGDSALFYAIRSVMEPVWVPGVLALVAVAFSLLAIRFRFEAFSWGGPAFLVGAIATWANGILGNHSYPLWAPISLLVATAIIEFAGRKNLSNELVRSNAPHYFGATTLAVVTGIWSVNALSTDQMVWIFPIVSAAFIGYGALIKKSQSQIVGQLFLLGSMGLAPASHSSVLSLAPLASTLLARWYIGRFQRNTRWFSTRKSYEIISLGFFAYWVFRYLPDAEFSSVFALSGLALFGGGLVWKKRELVYYSLTLSGLSLLCFFIPVFHAEPFNLALPFCLVLEHYIFTRSAAGWFGNAIRRLSATLASGAVLSAFIHVSQNFWHGSFGFYLTVGWTLLGFGSIVIGWLVRERIYRLSGLGLLGLALSKIALLDVWRLELLARIISFMVLGVVLVLIGFVYTKYQNKIRQWL
jgi:uncharacterized membrane protein